MKNKLIKIFFKLVNRKSFNIIMSGCQMWWFVLTLIYTYKGDILRCVCGLLWVIVIEFVLKDKKNITVIKTDAVYLNENRE